MQTIFPPALWEHDLLCIHETSHLPLSPLLMSLGTYSPLMEGFLILYSYQKLLVAFLFFKTNKKMLQLGGKYFLKVMCEDNTEKKTKDLGGIISHFP